MRDYAGGKNQPVFLRSDIDRTKQAASGKSNSASSAVDRYLPHAGKVDHQSAVTSAEAGKAVPSAAYRSENPGSRSDSDRGLHVRDAGAAGDESRRALRHSIPNASGVRVFLVVWAKQIAMELTLQ